MTWRYVDSIICLQRSYKRQICALLAIFFACILPSISSAADYGGRARFLPDDEIGGFGIFVVYAWVGILFLISRTEDSLARFLGEKTADFVCDSLFTFFLIGGFFVFPMVLLSQYILGLKLGATAYTVISGILLIASFLICAGKLTGKEKKNS